MSVVDVTDAVGIEALLDPRVPTGLLFFFGPMQVEREDAPPRVVWIPVESTVESAEKSGPTPIGVAQNPKQILTRRQRVEAHCWGEDPAVGDPITQTKRDFQAAENLADVVWTALHTCTSGSYTPLSSDNGRPENLDRGWVFVLVFELLLPITEPVQQTVTPTTVSI